MLKEIHLNLFINILYSYIFKNDIYVEMYLLINFSYMLDIVKLFYFVNSLKYRFLPYIYSLSFPQFL